MVAERAEVVDEGWRWDDNGLETELIKVVEDHLGFGFEGEDESEGERHDER